MKKMAAFMKRLFSRMKDLILLGFRLLLWLVLVSAGLFFLGLDAIRIYVFKRF